MTLYMTLMLMVVLPGLYVVTIWLLMSRINYLYRELEKVKRHLRWHKISEAYED